MLAAVVRRNGESLVELLQRLDAAIDQAINHETFIDEINEPRSAPHRAR